MPNLQFNGLIFLEEFFYKLYLKHQAEVIGVIVWLSFLASTYTSNLNEI